MLIRNVASCDGVVLGGEHPGLVLVLKVQGGKAKLGFAVDTDVPILNLGAFRAVLLTELTNDLPAEDIGKLRRMLTLLEDPADNATEITQLLKDHVIAELLHEVPEEVADAA
ncbi:MAG: hypothetical protein PHI23_00970 [Candidatus Peribacteraceae bacterium]|nr:hypothetical protein [Candidatus Peribacteraceae bacterium]